MRYRSRAREEIQQHLEDEAAADGVDLQGMVEPGFGYPNGSYEYIIANALLDAAAIRQPDDAELLNLKGLVVEQQSGSEAAIPYFKRSIEIDPDNVQGLFNVGRYYYNLAATAGEKLSGNALKKKVVPLYRQAQPYMERVHRLDPANTDATDALRTIYYRTGEGRKLQELEQGK